MTFFMVYVSTAHRLMSEGELLELLEGCHRYNTTSGITGALLYYDGTFMQVLEGDQHQVETLYDKVASDPRHHDVTKIIQGTSPHRQFADWSMAFRNLSTTDDVLGFSDFLSTRLSPYGDSPSAAQRVLLSFRNTLTLRR